MELYVVGSGVVDSLLVEEVLLLDEALELWREPLRFVLWRAFVLRDGVLDCLLEQV